MTFLPIVARELRVASRRWGTYWLRTGIALVVLGIGVWVYLMARRESPASLSMALFATVTGVAGVFCLTAGSRATADCLSEEKRDGTLGLLFLTDLRGYDVVFGKLFASSLNTLYGLLAVLPMLAIPLLMGGVTAGEFWRMTLVLLNTLFFSLAVGMISSALTKSARNAAGLCMLIVLGIAALLPMLGAIHAGIYNLNQPDPLFLLPSPGFAFFAAFDSFHRGHVIEFYVSLIIVHALSWIFLAAACLIVPRSWQDRPAGVVKLRWRDHWLRWSLGDTAERAAYRERLLDVNPFFWLASRARIKPALVWAVLGTFACGWIWGWLKFGDDWTNPGTYIVTALLLNSILKGWVAGETCAQLAEDRRIGALELLISTPLDVRAIIRGQCLALVRQFLWPLLFVVGVEAVFLMAGLQSRDVGNESGVWALVWIAGLIVLGADLVTLFYVSLWQSLTARNANRANSAAMMRVMAVPWILFGVFCAFIATASFSTRQGLNGEFFIIFWLLISLGVDAFFGLRAKLKLEAEFRQVAMTRYTPGVPIWQRLFGSRSPGVTRDS